jgi:phosphatidate cytidylyltransferase
LTNFRTRTLTGIVFVAVVVGAILLGPLSFIGLFFAITLATVLEFYRVTAATGLRPQRFMGALICMLFVAFIAYVSQERFKMGFTADLAVLFKTPVIILSLIFLLFFTELFRGHEKPFLNIGLTILGLFYIAIPYSLFCMTGLKHHGGVYSPHVALGFLCILWANDTGAYLVGSRFGKHKLIERISPGKTREGAAGGVAAAVLTAVVLAYYFTRLAVAEWVAMAVIIAVTATLGDLVASMLKRSYGIKDSGTVFPGHGGFLDRFDGLLGAAPFVYLFLYLSDNL